MSRAARGAVVAVAVLGLCAGLAVALAGARRILGERLAARATRELGVELSDPSLELRAFDRELQLLAKLSWQRGGAALQAERARVRFPLAALLDSGSAAATPRLELFGARLELTPRALDPELPLLESIRLEDLSGQVSLAAGASGRELELRGRLASGGTLSLRGHVAADDAPGTLELELRDVQLDALRPAITELQQLTGEASGPCRVDLAGSELRGLSCNLALANAGLRAGELAVAGALQLAIELALAPGARGRDRLRSLSGRFRIDARAASLSFGGLTRPAGQPALIQGEVLPGPDRPRLEYKLHFEDFELSPHGEISIP